MVRHISVSLVFVVAILSGAIAVAHTPPDHARVYFVGLEDGATVRSPITVIFGIEGFGITPAETKGKQRHTAGHHHLLVDVEELPSMDRPIPRDSNHLHFDRGETETLLELPPGEHTLQLLLGDEEHEPQDPPLISDKIRIFVE